MLLFTKQQQNGIWPRALTSFFSKFDMRNKLF